MSTTDARSNPAEVMVASLVDVVGNLCWAQDQGEKVLRTWIDQSRITREEAREMGAKVAVQVRQNQEEMQKWVRSTVEMSMATLRPATVAQMEALTRRVDELTRKVEELSRSRK